MKDRHHILFTASAWNSSEFTAGLRNQPSLIPRIDRDSHDALHRHVTTVPLIDHHLASRALRNFTGGSTPLRSMDNLLFALETGMAHPQTRSLDKQLGALTIHAIELQKPYIDPGISKLMVIDLAS